MLVAYHIVAMKYILESDFLDLSPDPTLGSSGETQAGQADSLSAASHSPTG